MPRTPAHDPEAARAKREVDNGADGRARSSAGTSARGREPEPLRGTGTPALAAVIGDGSLNPVAGKGGQGVGRRIGRVDTNHGRRRGRDPEEASAGSDAPATGSGAPDLA